MHYDVIVIGIGGMGSACAYQLAQRGLSVLGLEQFNIAHDKGSSHGVTRIIRLAYYENPAYVPLMHRAYSLWNRLEQEAKTKLFYNTGSIDAGPEDSQVFASSLESCRIHKLPHRVLTSAELTEAFPGYHLPLYTMAVFQPQGGFLTPERCIEAYTAAAQAHGAAIRTGERVLDWEPSTNGVRVRTDRSAYEANKLVLTAGAWIGKLFPKLAPHAIPERQVLIWTAIKRPELFTPERFPVFNLKVDEGRFYGFPQFGIPGFKYGMWHHRNQIVDPDTVDRETHPEDESLLRALVERYFPDAAGATLAMKVCMFTNTPDEDFILDSHPDYPQVVVGSACSGHGFKFCSVIGEILADLVQTGSTQHEIGFLRLKRFVNS
jgi:sarcosine oxidase